LEHICSMSRRYVVNIKGFATILSNYKEFKCYTMACLTFFMPINLF
jgi:hypothetical protein